VTDEYLDSCEWLDLATGKWGDVPNMPTKRSGCVANFMNDRILVIGGFDGNEESATMEVFDLKQNTWSRGPDMLTRRSGCASIIVQDYVIVVGGYNSLSGCLKTVELYDSTNQQWSFLGSMSHAREGCGASLVGDKVVIFGGFDGPEFQKKTEVLRLPDGVLQGVKNMSGNRDIDDIEDPFAPATLTEDAQTEVSPEEAQMAAAFLAGGPSIQNYEERPSDARLLLILLGESEQDFPELLAATKRIGRLRLSELKLEARRRCQILPKRKRVPSSQMGKAQLLRWLEENPTLRNEEKPYFQWVLGNLDLGACTPPGGDGPFGGDNPFDDNGPSGGDGPYDGDDLKLQEIKDRLVHQLEKLETLDKAGRSRAIQTFFASGDEILCPKLLWMLPDKIPESQFEGKWKIFFICEKTYRLANPETPLELELSRQQFRKISPLLKAPIAALKVGGTVSGIPLPPIPGGTPATLDRVAAEYDRMLESTDRKGSDGAMTKQSTGQAYRFLCELALEPENRSRWEPFMSVEVVEGKVAWVAKEWGKIPNVEHEQQVLADNIQPPGGSSNQRIDADNDLIQKVLALQANTDSPQAETDEQQANMNASRTPATGPDGICRMETDLVPEDGIESQQSKSQMFDAVTSPSVCEDIELGDEDYQMLLDSLSDTSNNQDEDTMSLSKEESSMVDVNRGPSVKYHEKDKSASRLLLVLRGQTESEFPDLPAASGAANLPSKMLREEVNRRSVLLKLPRGKRISPSYMTKHMLEHWLRENPAPLEAGEKIYFQRELKNVLESYPPPSAGTAPEGPKHKTILPKPLKEKIAKALRRSVILEAVKPVMGTSGSR